MINPSAQWLQADEMFSMEFYPKAAMVAKFRKAFLCQNLNPR
jgi:hypothetical protein